MSARKNLALSRMLRAPLFHVIVSLILLTAMSLITEKELGETDYLIDRIVSVCSWAVRNSKHVLRTG